MYSGTTTLSLTNHAVGNLMMVAIENNSATVWPTGVTGGGCTWTVLGTVLKGVTNPGAC